MNLLDHLSFIICGFIMLSAFGNWIDHVFREALGTCGRALSTSSRLIRYPGRRIGIFTTLILSI